DRLNPGAAHRRGSRCRRSGNVRPGGCTWRTRSCPDPGHTVGAVTPQGAAMKSVLRVLTAVALLVLVGAAAAEEQEILHSVTAPQIQSMLGELGFTGNEVDEDGDVIVMMQGHPVVI